MRACVLANEGRNQVVNRYLRQGAVDREARISEGRKELARRNREELTGEGWQSGVAGGERGWREKQSAFSWKPGPLGACIILGKDRRRFFSYHFGWLPYFAFLSFRRVSFSYLFGNYDEEWPRAVPSLPARSLYRLFVLTIFRLFSCTIYSLHFVSSTFVSFSRICISTRRK